VGLVVVGGDEFEDGHDGLAVGGFAFGWLFMAAIWLEWRWLMFFEHNFRL
jgi:hypothetical protein